MNTQGENDSLKQFLLGNSPDEAAEEIGVRIIGEPEFAEEMSFAEESLVEDFLDDDLTAGEKELFYANFLTTPRRVELLKETATLRNYARNQLKKDSESFQEKKKPASFLENLRGFLSLNLRPIAAVFLVLILVSVAWRVFFYRGETLTPLEKEYAALNAKDLSNAPEVTGLSNKSLLAGTFRDADSTAKLSAAGLTEKVLFRLALPPETPREELFTLELVKGGQIVFRQEALKVYQNTGGQELKVILPRGVLSKGIYQLKLNNGATYGLAVE
jgi:hypothetical protein